MEKSGADVESRAWLRVQGSLDEVDCLGIQKSRCLCKAVQVGDRGDGAGRQAKVWRRRDGVGEDQETTA